MRLLLSCLLLLLATPDLYADLVNIPDSLLKFKVDRDIKVGIKQSEPFVILESGDDPTGVSIELWEGVASDLDLTYEYVTFETLDDLLRAVESDSVDISINPITVTPDRLIQMEFSQPFFITNLAIAVQRKDSYPLLRVFKLILSQQFLEILAALAVIILIFGFLAWLFERKHNKDQFGPGASGLWDAFWWSAVTMTTVGYGDKAPKSIGGRIVGLFWMFAAIIIIGVFTGTVASLLTVDKLSLDINDLDDLNKADVLTIKASTSEEYLRTKGIRARSIQDLETALDMLKQGEVDALIYDEPLLKYMIDKKPYAREIVIAPAKFMTQYYAYALPLKKTKIQPLNLAMIERIESLEWKKRLVEYGLD
jgi:ABC-type amino acid transport substrate-binding protein